MEFNAIVCATDFSEPAEAALRRALDLARPSAIPVHLVHVFRIGNYVAAARPNGIEQANGVGAALLLNSARADDRASSRLLQSESVGTDAFLAVELPVEQVVDRIFDQLADGIEASDEDGAELLLGEDLI